MLSPVRAFHFGHGVSASALAAPPDLRARNGCSRRAGTACGSSMAAEESGDRESGGAVSLSEWQGWGTASPIPAMVAEVIEGLTTLNMDTDAPMTFGGLGGKLQGSFKVQEDKKQREVYKSLTDSEEKLQFFSARQIACRLLGSRGYLCQKCWLAMEDCMCSKLAPLSLWHGIRFWLYMHPKDFLRQNNTGKLLWQLFGIEAASLCLFGIHEHENIMWDAFHHSGKNMVWFLYPNKSMSPHSVQDIFVDGISTNLEGQMMERWTLEWGDEDPPCVSLSTTGISAMHRLRPQPSWDRTCTAAAAAGLLSELHLLPEFSLHDLDKQGEAVEDALDTLLDALTTRRLKRGRSITRKERKSLLV